MGSRSTIFGLFNISLFTAGAAPSDDRTSPDGEVQLDMLDKALRILKLLRFLEHASYPKSSLSIG